MKLLTVGDSFTWGDELADQTQAWPCLLAEKINYDLDNLAAPGAGNTRIIRTVIENYLDADIVVIAWSNYARTEFSDEQGTYDIWPGCRGVKFIGELSHRKKLIEYFNRNHNMRYMYKQYLINILLLQSFLQQHGKKYLMLDAFGNLEKRHQFYNLTKQVDSSRYVGWPDETMMEWADGCAKGPGGHFLEQGHKRVADKIYEHIRNLSWIS